MKKYIVIALMIILMCIGLTLNMILNRQINPSSEQICVSHCLQSLVWTPIGIFGGLYLLMYSDSVVMWFKRIFDEEIRSIVKSLSPNKFVVRLSGIVLLMLTLWDLGNNWNTCSKALDILIGK